MIIKYNLENTENNKKKMKCIYNSFHSEKLLFTFHYILLSLFFMLQFTHVNNMGRNADTKVWFYLIFLNPNRGHSSLHN